ncbi:MAG: lipoate--protein ligase family protein [Gemmatimonadales bacterium]
MAIDESLLQEADRTGGAWLRLYRWDPPCLSLGRNEPARTRFDRAAIERLGLTVIRRPTGGRAVWHEHEVTYAAAAPLEVFGNGSLAHCYTAIHTRLAEALRSLGVPAELAASRRALGPGAGACFASSVGGEVVVHGRKVIGSAQVRHGTAFLQHGSILLNGSQEVIRVVSRPPSAVSSAASLSEILGRPVGFEEVARAVIATWGEPVPEALLAPPRPATSRFSDPAWIWRR